MYALVFCINNHSQTAFTHTTVTLDLHYNPVEW